MISSSRSDHTRATILQNESARRIGEHAATDRPRRPQGRLEGQAVEGGTMSEVVQCEVREGVALLTLNRPERLNAWTGEMEREYFGLLEECGGSEGVRVIVVTGAGRGFCAGADMQELQAIGDGEVPSH